MGSVLASALLLGLTGTLSVKYELYRSKYHMVLTFISSTSLRPGTSVTQGVFIEMFITCALAIVVLMLAAEKHQATAFAPVSPILVILDCSVTDDCADWNRPDLILMPPVRVSYGLHACMCELILVKFRNLLHRRFDEHCSILWSSSGLRIPDSKSLGGTSLLLPPRSPP
jgi:hypothetical protein